ncbi:MAG: hypothetical protein KTR26_09755 [Flammeovirgaceae bacterium]|nr:hypothetical protein [Flammeovirgaceae bacterium]
MYIIFNAMFLAMVYLALIAFMLAKPANSNGINPKDDSDNDRGDGGWDDSDDNPPPFDLPPGIFILKPDEDDPSLLKKVEEEILV